MNEENASLAADVKPAVEQQSNMTMADLAARRVGQMTEKAQAEKPKSEPDEAKVEAEVPAQAEESEAESQESQPEEPKAKEGDKDVLSKVDLSELTDEDIAELAQKGKSGLLKRIAELTAKRKLAEEKAAQLEAAFRQNQPVALEAKVENNPLSNLNTVQELQERYNQVAEVIEWSEDVLDRAENLGADDPVATINGQEVTKAKVREELRRARKEMQKFLPARLKEIQAQEHRKQLKQTFEQSARQELPWLDGEDNDLRKNYESMVKDPLVERIVKAVPEIEPQLPYLLAHAANSIYGRKSLSISESKPAAPKMTPPKGPTTSAAGPERSADKDSKAVKEAAQRLRETGSMNDLIALRTAQLSKRKSVK